MTDPEAYGGDPTDSFHVVVPSLPGYGFSDRPEEPGFPAEPNVGPGAPELTEREKVFLEERPRGPEVEEAYAHMQRARPQTLSYALNDSPSGLASWVIEKWHNWSGSGDNVENRFIKDELLTTIMIYWATQTIGSSFRIYYDWALSSPQPEWLGREAPRGVTEPLAKDERIGAPSAVCLSPADPVSAMPREWVERAYADLRRFIEMPKGGHFAAMEEPELLAEDIRSFFRSLRQIGH